MTLISLTKKKTLTILGLNSGTSADGLDMAVIKINRDTKISSIKFVTGDTQPYPADLKKVIRQTADSAHIVLEDLIRLDHALGIFFGTSAVTYLTGLRRKKVRVDLIASHGQTVRHIPQLKKVAGIATRGTLQLGLPEEIATLTGLPVIADFRQADIAVGNEGAPITTGAMQRLFGDEKSARLIINIGGMSNYFYLPSKKSHAYPEAADCGPGNSLCDILTQRLFNKDFDRDGAIARKGHISESLLQLLLSQRFFTEKRISTGREEFGQTLALEIIDFGLRHQLYREDMLATTVELTAQGIGQGIQLLPERDKSLQSLYLTGGGRKNSFLVSRLKRLLPNLSLELIDSLGINGDLVEAAAYAVMGEACVRAEPINHVVSKRKRSQMAPILGRIIQSPVSNGK